MICRHRLGLSCGPAMKHGFPFLPSERVSPHAFGSTLPKISLAFG